MEEKLERKLEMTADGSHTLFVPAMDEHYHSVNGAVQESLHVFIEAGLRRLEKPEARILEIGFGTGLNAFLTLREQERAGIRRITYYSIERYPLDRTVTDSLNYGAKVWPERQELFTALHATPWNAPAEITSSFVLHKIEGDAHDCDLPAAIDLVYFDAFAPDKQPEMWTPALFHRLAKRMAPGGILVTYCAKGAVRRGFADAGFRMERLPGPPGKRHMLFGRWMGEEEKH